MLILLVLFLNLPLSPPCPLPHLPLSSPLLPTFFFLSHFLLVLFFLLHLHLIPLLLLFTFLILLRLSPPLPPLSPPLILISSSHILSSLLLVFLLRLSQLHLPTPPHAVKVTRLLYLHAARRPRYAALRPPAPIVATARYPTRLRSVSHVVVVVVYRVRHRRSPTHNASTTTDSLPPSLLVICGAQMECTGCSWRFFSSGGHDGTSRRSKTHSGFGLGGRQSRRLGGSRRSG